MSLNQIPGDFVPFSRSGAFCETNGPIYVRPSDATLAFRVRAEHCNPVRSCHGGWLAAFIDMQMPFAALQSEKLEIPSSYNQSFAGLLGSCEDRRLGRRHRKRSSPHR